MIAAIIPARSGSKRIPKKNIKNFMGKPMISYSINAARSAGVFDKIVVSTDSEEIARVAESYGAEVPFIRPAQLSDDYTGTDDVILHALNWFIEQDVKIDFVCCIYATAPFIRPEYIRKGLDILQKAGAISSFSVTTYPYTIFRSLKVDDAGKLKMFWPEYSKSRSQDLPEAFHDAGQFYWADVNKYLVEKRFFSNSAAPVIIPKYLVQDIDTMEDWERAENMFAAMKAKIESVV
jgi:pseudaminic acid cytidylyltransferase